MATELIDNLYFNLTRFGKGNGKVAYQITQYNENNKRQEYVCLTEKQIDRILKKIRKVHQ